MGNIIIVNDLNAGYMLRKGYIKAVNNVKLDIKSKEIIGIVGESGCGKSTLIRVIYGHIEPPLKVLKGNVIYVDQDGKSHNIVPAERDFLEKHIWWKKISWIPQAAQNIFNPLIKVYTHFEETLKAHGYRNIEEKESREMIAKHVKTLGLPSEVLDSYPHQLSGGMKQRVAIALATILHPKVVLADEPTSAVDVVVQKAILQLFERLRNDMEMTIVIVSHDIQMLSVITDRMAVMYAGEIIEVSNTKELFEEPLHPYTKALITSTPKLGMKEGIKGLPGQPPDLLNPPPGCKFHPRCPYVRDRCRSEDPPVTRVNDRSVKCWIYSG
ncbi:MAG: ABC transporter ATP-binding protein [Desulfurococcaceae archaeon]